MQGRSGLISNVGPDQQAEPGRDERRRNVDQRDTGNEQAEAQRADEPSGPCDKSQMLTPSS